MTNTKPELPLTLPERMRRAYPETQREALVTSPEQRQAMLESLGPQEFCFNPETGAAYQRPRRSPYF
jgi:hypothetical protein